jgi:hypothetical protein
LHYKRFTKNQFVEEKNPTIVNYPLRGVDFRDCMCRLSKRHCRTLTLQVDLDAPPSNEPTLYDLIANVTHESVAGTTRDKANTVWKVHVRAGGAGGDSEKWFMIQDLIVEETRKEMIFLGETVLQVSLPHVLFTFLFTYHSHSVDMGASKARSWWFKWRTFLIQVSWSLESRVPPISFTMY